MTNLSRLLSLFIALGTAGVGFSAFRDHLRFRDGVRRALAVSMGLLAASTILDWIGELTNSRFRGLMLASVVTFMASGYWLVVYRDRFLSVATGKLDLSFSRRIRAGLIAALVVTSAAVVATRVPSGWNVQYTTPQLIAISISFLLWCACAFEPMVRFWIESRRRPVVQRARMRAMSIGFGAIILLLLVGMGTAAAGQYDIAFTVGLQLATFPIIGVLYASFSPPRWLLHAWRAKEERHLMRATEGLIAPSADRRQLAERALDWSVRLVGADSGFIRDADGTLLASKELETYGLDVASFLVKPGGGARIVVIPGQTPRTAIAASLPFGSRSGVLAVFSGPATPPFTQEEVSRLDHYASSVALALDRARLDEMKDAFLTAVSHELRTPLTSVVGMAETLEEKLHLLDSGASEDLVRRLSVNARKLDRLLTDLLDVDRLTRGIIEPRRNPTDVGALVERIAQDAHVVRDRPVLVVTEPVVANVDAAQIERVVENLLSNATKHTPVGTRLWVRVAHERRGGVLIAVEDDGPGVPAELREAIFRPFRQGPLPGHSPGTGIGLTLVARFAELHGGRAWVQQRPGGGASFRVFLPGCTEPVEAPPALYASAK